MKNNKLSYVKNLSKLKSAIFFDIDYVIFDIIENQLVTKSMSKCQKRDFSVLTRITL